MINLQSGDACRLIWPHPLNGTRCVFVERRNGTSDQPPGVLYMVELAPGAIGPDGDNLAGILLPVHPSTVVKSE